MMDYNIRNGRTYMYFTGTPLYPFGYGLSYTTFTYANLKTSAAGIDAKSQITVSVDVTNSGTVDGEEVVQMYVKHMNSAVTRAIKELKGYSRVAIPAGKTQTVTLPLAGKDLAYWDSTNATWTVENDNVQLQIGASSADIRLNATLAVTNGGPVSIMEKEGNPSENPAKNTTFSALSVAQLLRHGPSIGLQFRLGAAADVDLRVFDLKGVSMAHVNRKNLSPGTHFIELQKTVFSPGLYLVGGKVGEFVYKSKCFIK
jgi:hypothetical protein